MSRGSVNWERLGFRKELISVEVLNPLLISICASAGEIEAVADRYFINWGFVLLTSQRLCTARVGGQGFRDSGVQGKNRLVCRPLSFLTRIPLMIYFFARSLLPPHRSTTGLATKIEE